MSSLCNMEPQLRERTKESYVESHSTKDVKEGEVFSLFCWRYLHIYVAVGLDR